MFVLLVWYLRMFLRDHSAVILTSFYQIFYSLGMLVSAALISGGAHMIEVNQYGTQNGFFWIMMIYFVAGMEMTRIGYNIGGHIHFGSGVRQLSAGTDRLLTFLIVGATLALAIYVFLLTGGPLMQGIDRVTFWRTMAPPGTTLLPSLVIQSFFFAAYYYLWQRKAGGSMLLPSIVVFGYILTAIFVLGQKFSVFIIFLSTWLLLLPGILPDLQFKLKHAALLSAVAISLLFYTAAIYIRNDQEASFIVTRAALQAQLLWSVFDDPGAISLLPREPDCYFGCGAFANGMDYISYKYLPEGLYKHYAEGGTVLSGFMPALSILTFGMIASILLHLMMTFVLGFTQRKMVASLASGNLVYSFLLLKTQFSLTIIWFAAQDGPLPGLLLTLTVIVLYRLVFSRNVGNSEQADDARVSGAPS